MDTDKEIHPVYLHHDHTYAVPDNISDGVQFKCHVCVNVFGVKEYLNAHLKIHKKIPRCKHCGIGFKGNFDLYKHTYFEHRHTHCSITEKGYECHKCDQAFHTMALLVHHNSCHHRKRMKRRDTFLCTRCQKASVSLKSNAAGHGSTIRHKCASCHKSFPTQSQLVKHASIHTCKVSFKCSKCNRDFTSYKEANVHLKSHPDDWRICSLCRCFSVDGTYVEKLSMDHNDGLLHCDVCDKMFRRLKNLKQHMKYHQLDKPHRCPICNKGYITPSALSEHLSSHAVNKPHQCHLCGRGFARKSALKVHHRIHTGEKPYKCEICGKSYTNNRGFKYHMATQHVDKTVEIAGPISVHQCSVCGICLARQHSLSRHMKIHSGTDKKHKCSQCGRGFSQPCKLRLHMNTHTGEKPHKCGHCDKSFGRPESLSRHVKQKHQTIC